MSIKTNPSNWDTITTLHVCAMFVFALTVVACGPPLLVVVDCDDEDASGDTGATGDTDEVLFDVLEGDGDGDPAGDGDEVPLDLPQGDGDGDAGECACVDPSPGDGDGDPAGDGDGDHYCGCGIIGAEDSLCFMDGVCAYFHGGCPAGGWQPICAEA